MEILRKNIFQNVLRLFFIFFSIICLDKAALPQNGYPVLHISHDEHSYFLGYYMSWFEDKKGLLDYNDIITLKDNNKFIPLSSNSINFGLTSSAYWLYFQIDLSKIEETPDHLELFFDPGCAFPGRVEWTLFNGTTGKILHSKDRKKAANIKFRISRETESYFLRIHSDTGLLLRPGLYTWKSYVRNNETSSLFFGFFYGIIIVVMIYNIFLGFTFKDKSFFWYSLHLLFVALFFFGINGFTIEYILSDKYELAGMLNRTLLGFMTVTVAMLTRSFLRTKTRTPVIDKIFIVFAYIACCIALINLFIPARFINTLMTFIGFLAPVFVIIAARGSYVEGYKSSRYFMYAWALYLLGMLSFSLTVMGIFPFTNAGFYGFQGGAASAALLLSLALNDRIKELQKQNTASRESMERISIILDSIESGIFLIESETNIIKEINKSAENLIGLHRNQIIGRLCFDFFESAGLQNNTIICNDPSDEYTETLLIKATGESFPVLRQAKQIELDGHFLILTSFTDISDIKKAEQAVRKSETKFRTLFESSRDAIIIIDTNTIIDCNKAALKMFKYSRMDKFIGKSPSDFFPELQPSGDESASVINKKFHEALAKGSSFFEWISKDFNGKEFSAEVMLSTVKLEGKILQQAVIRDISERKRLEEELKELATTDSLTGADNRRSFMSKAENELLRSKRYKNNFVLLMLDIDHFKKINDTYGHITGDLVLKEMVKECYSTLRQTDIIGRFGGEEFAIILIETDEENAYNTAERLKVNLSKISLDSGKGHVAFTVSIGLSEFINDDDTLDSIIARADEALYKAKNTGRNRVVRYSA